MKQPTKIGHGLWMGLFCMFILIGCESGAKEGVEISSSITPEPSQAAMPTETILATEATLPEETTPTIKEALPTEMIQPTEATSPTKAAPSEEEHLPTEAAPFLLGVSYLEVEAGEGITFYFSEDGETPHTVLKRVDQDGVWYDTYDWEYCLEYGRPLVKNMEADLLVALPTAEMTEPLSPIGAYEICGEMHVLCKDWAKNWGVSVRTDSANIDPAFFLGNSVASYQENEEGETVFTLELSCFEYPDTKQYFEFPLLSLPSQKVYPIVFEETSHFTETFLEYRRLGVWVGEEIVWLGKFCVDASVDVGWYSERKSNDWDADYLFFPDRRIGHYTGRRNGSFRGLRDGDLQTGLPCRLEPDALVDLDGDGVLEKVVYRKQPVDTTDVELVIYVDGVEAFRTPVCRNCFGNYPYIAKFAPKGAQILVRDYDVGAADLLWVYQYEDGFMKEAGRFEMTPYDVEIKDGRKIYGAWDQVRPLQGSMVKRKYEFLDGLLYEAEQEYYEFWGDNVVIPTAKQDIPLYYEKGGGKTFLLPEGSHVELIGGDLGEWIQVENKDTGEKGWIQVEWAGYGKCTQGYPEKYIALDGTRHYCSRQYYVETCILPDGSKAGGGSLFEGLIDYGS